MASARLFACCRKFVAVLALVLLAQATSCARVAAEEGDGLSIAAVLGFSDRFRPGHWTPLTVTVSNNGAAIDGALEVLTTDGDELARAMFTVTHRRTLTLGNGARKRYHFTLHLEHLSQPVRIRITSAGRTLREHPLELRERFVEERIVLVVSRDADLDYLNEQGLDGVRVVYPHPELLPHHWQGYDAVHAMLVHGVSLEDLAARQFDAIRKWIASGGTLVIAGSPDYSLLRTPRLRALLPAEPVGMVRIDDPRAVANAFGMPFDAERGVHANRVTAVHGEIVYRAGDVPLLIEQRIGAGRVVYFTADIARYPFDRWSGMKPLLTRHLGLDRRVVRAQPEDDVVSSVTPLSELMRRTPRGFPHHGMVLFFVVLYIGTLGAFHWIRPGSSSARAVAGWLVYSVPALFIPGAYVLFGALLFHDGPAVAQVSLLEPIHGTPYARAQSTLGIYANDRRSLELRIDGMMPVMRSMRQDWREDASADWIFRYDDGVHVRPLDTRRFVLHRLQAEDLVAFHLGAHIERTPRGLRVELRNDSGRPMQGLRVLYGGRVYDVGSLGEDAVLDRHFDRSEGDDVDPQAWWRVLSTEQGQSRGAIDAAQMLLARRHRERARIYDDTSTRALVFGFTDAALVLASDDSDWRAGGVNVVLAAVPVPSGAARGRR